MKNPLQITSKYKQYSIKFTSKYIHTTAKMYEHSDAAENYTNKFIGKADPHPHPKRGTKHCFKFSKINNKMIVKSGGPNAQLLLELVSRGKGNGQKHLTSLK